MLLVSAEYIPRYSTEQRLFWSENGEFSSLYAKGVCPKGYPIREIS